MLDAKILNNAANYAQQCYSNNSASLVDCGRFVTQSIYGYVNKTAGCPFREEMWRKSSSNLWLDTGYISSHRDLGLNAPRDRSIVWGNVLHCEPLVTKGFTSHNMTSVGNLTLYKYGTTNHLSRNVTYSAESVESQISHSLSHNMITNVNNYHLR